jgi:hypothetical protein
MGIRNAFFGLRKDFDIHAAIIDEIAQRAESQSHELVVEGIELTHGGNVEEVTTEEGDVASKGTLGWNGFGNQ